MRSLIYRLRRAARRQAESAFMPALLLDEPPAEMPESPLSSSIWSMADSGDFHIDVTGVGGCSAEGYAMPPSGTRVRIAIGRTYMR